ncbi:MAG: hypothetical protein QNK20_15605 [Aureibaculum sp.]|nr:hypothetical protein [Aureibaculum sp.]
MKKLKFLNSKITLSALAFCIILIMMSCEQSPRQVEDISKADIEAMKENHIITLNEAVKQYDKYSKQRVTILKDTLKKKYNDNNFSDTRTVWFDIKTIKAYIKYIEDNSSEAEGLQFYFGVNPDKIGKQKNHQTFFIAPTVQNIVNGNTIQSGYTMKNGKRVFIYEAIKEYLNSESQNVQKASIFSMPPSDDDLILNEGTDSPPNGNN